MFCFVLFCLFPHHKIRILRIRNLFLFERPVSLYLLRTLYLLYSNPSPEESDIPSILIFLCHFKPLHKLLSPPPVVFTIITLPLRREVTYLEDPRPLAFHPDAPSPPSAYFSWWASLDSIATSGTLLKARNCILSTAVLFLHFY